MNLIGQSLGRYHILEQLGEGGMAVVYKAYDTRLETEVAVKVIRTERFTPKTLGQTLVRFEREAKALARLTHPNIVKVTDYGEYEGRPYLVMPYLPGGTLKHKMDKPVPWQKAVRLLLPIAQALGFAHQHGIIHRDVKPANILITESGAPMLTDFGVAKLFEGEKGETLTATGFTVGTPEYMAPEQWTGSAVAQSDIYALGVVLYEMVTGRKPYIADTPAAILLKQATEPLPSPHLFCPDLPEAVEKLLLKALAKQPEDRYADMDAFIRDLRSLLVAPSSITGRKARGGHSSRPIRGAYAAVQTPKEKRASENRPRRVIPEKRVSPEKNVLPQTRAWQAIPVWWWGGGAVLVLVVSGLLFLGARKSLPGKTSMTSVVTKTSFPTQNPTVLSQTSPSTTSLPVDGKARILSLDGVVYLNGDFVTAAVGDDLPLTIGDHLATGLGARLLLDLGGKEYLALRDDAEISLMAVHPLHISIIRGRVLLAGPQVTVETEAQDFQANAANAVLGLIAELDAGNLWVDCLDGKCTLSGGLTLRAGQRGGWENGLPIEEPGLASYGDWPTLAPNLVPSPTATPTSTATFTPTVTPTPTHTPRPATPQPTPTRKSKSSSPNPGDSTGGGGTGVGLPGGTSPPTSTPVAPAYP